MIAYKIVCNFGGKLYSYTSNADNPTRHGNVEYKPGVARRPKRGHGPLCAFSSLYEARCHGGYGSFELWECEVSLSRQQKEVWEVDEEGNYLWGGKTHIGKLYSDTILCSSITLTRRIQ